LPHGVGTERAVDYLVTEEPLTGAIAVVGHSRNGRPLLQVILTTDCAHHSLQAGWAEPRRAAAKSAIRQKINDHFPTGSMPSSKKFNNSRSDCPRPALPHRAVRAGPVLFANATEDTWANPAGQFEMCARLILFSLLGTTPGAQQIPERGNSSTARWVTTFVPANIR